MTLIRHHILTLRLRPDAPFARVPYTFKGLRLCGNC
jgi:hypothetical protein